jgi:serine/threonine-protein kinase
MKLIDKCIQAIRKRSWTRWFNGLAVSVLILVILFLFFDELLMPLVTRQGKECIVPEIVGLSSDAAEDTLRKLGLGARVILEEYSPDRPAGVILSQNPEAGSVTKKGRNIRVTVSKGGKLVEVPKLRGISLRQAEIMLSEKGLKIGDLSWTYNDSFPEDVVVSATPSFGTTVPKGISVGLTVNKFTPEGAVIVPQFIGKNVDEAQDLAKEAGLEIGIIRYKVDNSLLPRTVVEQVPKAGAEVNRGSMVELVVTITE